MAEGCAATRDEDPSPDSSAHINSDGDPPKADEPLRGKGKRQPSTGKDDRLTAFHAKLPPAQRKRAKEEGWCDAKIRAWLERDTRPNAYYYRFLDEDEEPKSGPWSEEELAKLKAVCLERGVNVAGSQPEWGTISRCFPGRVGYTCSAAYRKMVDRHEIEDPNYEFVEGKSRYVFGGRQASKADVVSPPAPMSKRKRQKRMDPGAAQPPAPAPAAPPPAALPSGESAGPSAPPPTPEAGLPLDSEETPARVLAGAAPKRQKVESGSIRVFLKAPKDEAAPCPHPAVPDPPPAPLATSPPPPPAAPKKALRVKTAPPEAGPPAAGGSPTLAELGSARAEWRWASQHTFRRVQTMKDDQAARTPEWLLRHLRATHGDFFDPAPARRGKAFNGLEVRWKAVNYINPPFTETKAFLEKGAREAARRTPCHSMFLLPCAKLHCKYFADVFPRATAVEIFSETIAFEGYSSKLPHALMLLHMGKPLPAPSQPGAKMHLLTVPPPSSFEQVRRMVLQHGYPQCYVLANHLSGPLMDIFADFDAKRPDCLAILFPCRFENRWVSKRIVPQARGIFPCVGTLRPGDADRNKVWSGSTLAIFDTNDSRYAAFLQHPWVSHHSAPVTPLDVPAIMAPAPAAADAAPASPNDGAGSLPDMEVEPVGGH